MNTDEHQDAASNETTSPAPASAPAAPEATPAAPEGTAPADTAADTAAEPAPEHAPEAEPVTAAEPAPAEEPAKPAEEPEHLTQADYDRIGREAKAAHEHAQELAQEAARAAAVAAAAAPAVATADPDMLALQRDLQNYANQMSPAMRLTAHVGAAMQLSLFRTLMRVVTIQGDKFAPLWSAVLAFAFEHRNDLWSDRYINRFVSDMGSSVTDLRNFEKLRHVIAMTADPQSRAVAVKNMDFASILKFMTNAQAQQNLLGFYNAA